MQWGKSSVTLYGLIDGTISSVTNANAAGQRVTSYQTAWFSGDRWGVTGKRELSNSGLKGIFKLESEYEIATGNQDTPGVLFNRDAWIGFESADLGKLTFGRQNAIARDFTGIYGDPYGGARVTLEEGGYTNNNNFKQLIFYAASATGTRYDRGVVWKKEFGNFVAGVGYQFGGVAGDFSNGSTKTLAFGYNGDGDAFHLAGFVNNFNVAGLTHKAWSVGGNVALNDLIRLHGGYYGYNSEQGGGVGNRKDKAYTLSTKITPGGPLDFEVGYQILKAVNAGLNGSGFVLTPYANALGVTRVATGNKKTAYASAFYHFDKMIEVYLALDRMTLTDGYKLAVTNGHQDQTEIGVGMRLKF
ncbi:MAG: porin [Betaproteobacteria bacterium]|nr:porin [Betaproteobacteria bacterium]